MLSTKQAQDLTKKRAIVAAAHDTRDGRLALRYSQVGLPFVSDHSAFITIHLISHRALSLDHLRQLADQLHHRCQEMNFEQVVVIGVGFELWTQWSAEAGYPTPKGFSKGEILDVSPPYKRTGGDLFFHVKSQTHAACEATAGFIRSALDGVIAQIDITLGDSRNGGRVYGGRILHGLIGSVDAVGVSARAIIGDEDAPNKGGCFGLTQRFVHDWQKLGQMSETEIENLIGRDHKGNIIPSDDDRSHVKTARVNDADHVNYRILGQSHPYGQSPSGRGNEKGIFVAAYAKSAQAFDKVLASMVGDEPGYIKSRHLNVSHSDAGNYWYMPSARQLGLPSEHETLALPMNAFFQVRSANGYMYYNTKDYLHSVGNHLVAEHDRLSDRVIELIGITFSRWHDTWYRKRPAPPIGHLSRYLEAHEESILNASIAERKGMAAQKTLEMMSSEPYGRLVDTFRIHPKERIVGVLPDFTLGSGSDVMTYLHEEERLEGFLLNLNEFGAAGHNVPDHSRILDKGVQGLLDDVTQRLAEADEEEARAFYQSVAYALQGVQIYLENYAALARKVCNELAETETEERRNLEEIAQRLDRLVSEPPISFLDAAQLVFSVHCCLHLVGESVSIGRLDQLLAPFYAADEIDESEAQEILDCFWIKMDEKVLYNRLHFEDRLTYGSGAITYEGGDFPQGAAINQWVQQVTVGGYKANDAEFPEDASNTLTRLCLRSARRLPLNAPCLSLRVHPNSPDEIIVEAAKALLSGGAHPLLLNDDKLAEGLLRGASSMTRADSRDMVCDGCFEALVAGRSEFAFSYVPVPDAIEMAFNEGRTISQAGPVHITGLKASFRSKPAGEITSFDEFYAICMEHYRWKMVRFYDGMLSRYGNLNRVCPSPLLSALIHDCLENGRDLTAGGARYHILAPLMNGISTAIDALWAIKCLVYDDDAVTTLPELRECLICDWGFDMKEPFQSSFTGPLRSELRAQRFKQLREKALRLSKFGEGDASVDAFGDRVVTDLVGIARDTIRNPVPALADKLDELRKRYALPGREFEFVITPGIATFEDYAGLGLGLGASADGRRNNMPVASDFSPTPSPQDLPVDHREREILRALRAWNTESISVGLSNGAPVDTNIPEDFPLETLQEVILAFANGEIGSNMLTVSCADPDTLEKAQKRPEQYDLVRLRMGGWTEFFITMFPHHQEQHRRRPIFLPRIEGPAYGPQ